MALDNFIPENAVKLCNKCRLRKNYTATCDVYPSGIPKKVLLSSDCPNFDPKEQDGTHEKGTAPIIEDGKTLDELVAKSPYGQSIVQHERELGATDEEIWEFLMEL